MPRTRDLGRSREIIARRKQERALAVWDPTRQVDTSWMKFAKCKLCGIGICVNNYADRKVRMDSHRHLGVFVCWRCIPFVKPYRYIRDMAKTGDKKAMKLMKKLPWGRPVGTGRQVK